MSNKLFGTDGVRGVANTYPMNAEFVFRLAQVLSRLVCTQKRRVAIGKDTRLSGDMLEAALAAGFASEGVDVVCLGVVPTPLLTAETHKLNVDMSLMITASHNPYQDNGIKLINYEGDKFSDSESAEIEKLLLSDTVFKSEPERIGRIFSDTSPVADYIQNALSTAPDADALKGLRVVLDCANGAFYEIMPQVFKNLGAGIITLANTPNGRNINQDCGSQHTEKMAQVVRDSHAQLGIAVDGDGDRIIITDENGTRLDGDQIIAFLATYYHQEGLLKGNAAVATIWSNLGLEKYLKTLGLDFYRTPVGERYVIEKMKETGVNVGGEESGHMVLSDYAKTGDALLTALVICYGLMKSGKKMSKIFPLFEKCPCQIHNIRFETPEQVNQTFNQPSVQKAISEAVAQVEGRGSVIVRKSGTEPVLKIRVEAEDATLVETTAQKLVQTVRNFQKA